MYQRDKWQFVDTGTWTWVVTHPDGTQSEAAKEFTTLGECAANAAQHGYVVWKSGEDRRRESQLGVMDALKRNE